MKTATANSLYPLLVIDAGNSLVKFAIIRRRGGRPQIIAGWAGKELTTACVKSLARKSGAVRFAAASVVLAMTKTLRAALPGIFIVDRRTALNFPTIVDRRTVGADRLANMAEAARHYGRGVLVADFGTAATFDLLDERGCFVGGAIAPGVRTFASALSSRTALLPLVKIAKPPRRPGRHTIEAIQAGLSRGYAGMVREILAAPGFSAKHLIFTGGDARMVKGLTGQRASVDPLWTLRGIAALADQPRR
jgi:pantothenate kinase type III